MNGDESRQTTEVRETNAVEGNTAVTRQTVATSTGVDNRVVMSRVVWYIVGFVLVLLAFRLVLMLLGAAESSPFVGFVYALSGVFAWPFYGIFPQPVYGASALDTASIVGMVVYALIAWGIAKLITLDAPHRDV